MHARALFVILPPAGIDEDAVVLPVIAIHAVLLTRENFTYSLR